MLYCCSLSDVMKHSHSYPILTNTLQALNSRGTSIDSKVLRMNDLLRSFEGHVNHLSEQGKQTRQMTVFFGVQSMVLIKSLKSYFVMWADGHLILLLSMIIPISSLKMRS